MKTVQTILHLALIVLGTALSMIAVPIATVLLGGSEAAALTLFWLILTGGGIAFIRQTIRFASE